MQSFLFHQHSLDVITGLQLPQMLILIALYF